MPYSPCVLCIGGESKKSLCCSTEDAVGCHQRPARGGDKDEPRVIPSVHDRAVPYMPQVVAHEVWRRPA